MRSRTFATTAALLAGALPVASGAVAAQSPDLARVEALVSDGRFSSARERLQAWMDESGDSASREDVQHGLWLRAVLTVDAQMAELDLQRLVVEYRGGPFSDEALLRLAQVARARSDPERAEQRLESLLRDYPGSPHVAEARSMLAELHEMPPPESIPTEPVAPEPAVLEPGIREPPLLEPPAPAEPSDPLPFTVQLGAFTTESRAQTMAASADALGLDVRVVHVEGSDLVHVRTGAFSSRAEADARALDLRNRGLPALVAMDRASETPLE